MIQLQSITPIILAGGKGTRLKSVISELPKVLAPVNGQPFIAFLLEILQKAGFQKCVLSTGFMAEKVEAAFGDNFQQMKLIYSKEESPLGTGGGVRQAMTQVGTPYYMVLNGDSFVEFELSAFLNEHSKGDHYASLVLRKVDDAGRYGKVEIDTNLQITDFKEKVPDSGAGWINAGVYLLPKEELLKLPLGQPSSIEVDLLPQLCVEDFHGFLTEGAFLDIGLPETYQKASLFFTELQQDNNI